MAGSAETWSFIPLLWEWTEEECLMTMRVVGLQDEFTVQEAVRPPAAQRVVIPNEIFFADPAQHGRAIGEAIVLQASGAAPCGQAPGNHAAEASGLHNPDAGCCSEEDGLDYDTLGADAIEDVRET